MQKYKQLFSDTIIFAIGNLGSKLINFLLVPLYTSYLSASEYGLVDLVTTTSYLLLPIISLSVYEAVLRLAMDKNANKEVIFSNSAFVTIVSSILLLLGYFLMSFFWRIETTILFLFVIVIFNSFQSLLSQLAKSLNNNKEYAISGILSTFTIAFSNIVFIKYLNLGVNGYLYSLILGILLSIIYLSLKIKPKLYWNLKKISILGIKNILAYSIPLIPNSINIWLTNAVSRYFIWFFIGEAANGLYAVANKIPSLLGIITSVFYQAWQLFAIKQFDSKDSSKMYTTIYKKYANILFVGVSFLLAILKPFMTLYVSEDFYNSWKYVPLLLIGTIFSNLSGFLGITYIAAKNTKGIMRTTIIGAILNVILNVILVPIIGINGSPLSILISYIVVWLYRTSDVKNHVNIVTDKIHIFTNTFVLLIQTLVLYLVDNYSVLLSIEFILLLIVLLLNMKLFIDFYKFLKKRNIFSP